MSGTLYLVATPIGNLEDITLRALRILREADLIACEDTRTSRPLLAHYGIRTPVTSYHKFNEKHKSETLVDALLSGKNVALITDAGTPLISDPGYFLVCACREAGIPVTAVPGASAAVTALSLSGMDTRRFSFEGFLPDGKKERRELLDDLGKELRTMVFYASPHHLRADLSDLAEALGADRPAAVCRELTKRFETVLPMTLSEACRLYETEEPRGEYVLVVAGRPKEEAEQEERSAWESLAAEEHVRLYEAQGKDRKEAMRLAARDRGVSRREIYAELLQKASAEPGGFIIDDSDADHSDSMDHSDPMDPWAALE